MITSDIVGSGSRPMTNLSSVYYRQRSADVLAAASTVSVEDSPSVPQSYLDTAQFEFPGDATYARYLTNRLGV